MNSFLSTMRKKKLFLKNYPLFTSELTVWVGERRRQMLFMPFIFHFFLLLLSENESLDLQFLDSNL